MTSIAKPYLARASIFAGFALLMGISLSFFVYQANVEVKRNAVDLVENRIPILSAINDLMADLSEQERIIYEYYRSQDHQAFEKSSSDIKTLFDMHITAVVSQQRFSKESTLILDGQEKIQLLFQQFYQAMQLEQDNWDELRTILTSVSNVRIQLLPTLRSIELQTKQTVDEGHQATLDKMDTSHWLVISYGISILLIAGIISWYIRRYIIAQMKNTRLALFSHKNPNPILSVNNLGEIVFNNPASIKLLTSVGYKQNEIKKLLPDNFVSLRQQLSSQQEHSLVIEKELNELILQVNIYWHQEVDAYDIHIIDMTQRKLAEEKVKRLAFYQQETNLPNQYKFNHDIDELIASSDSFSIGTFEIRAFDEKVSTLGLETTESIVKALAKNILHALPAGVRFFHTNESQFALMCPKSTNEVALKELTDVVLSVASKSLITHCGEFFVELDFGYACYPMHGKDRNSLIKNAHSALAVASENDHKNYCLFEEKFFEDKLISSELVNKLRFALDKAELFLVFQPQLDIQSNAVTGIETLVRWHHNGEIVSPAEFIPLAEQSGLIIPIGQWILQQAALFTKRLVDMGYIDIVVAVNVSPRQFSHPDFCQMVENSLETSQLPPHNLELEITEGVFMHNEENTLSVLTALKEMGIHLSIDDFGTGYSSLSYLKRFPIDKLKIDQSFIKECHQNDEDKAIVKTIISLGKSLNLSLIAEGVEEEVHLDFLKSLGCDEIQGYWFSKPIQSEDLIKFLEKNGGDIKVEPIVEKVEME